MASANDARARFSLPMFAASFDACYLGFDDYIEMTWLEELSVIRYKNISLASGYWVYVMCLVGVASFMNVVRHDSEWREKREPVLNTGGYELMCLH